MIFWPEHNTMLFQEALARNEHFPFQYFGDEYKLWQWLAMVPAHSTHNHIYNLIQLLEFMLYT